ncbi:MAG: hypothetical protein JRH11_05160 [Deltaproteobacteria bacterium]|nr:hypothetical protein [Deltaproteobacteria bacterium]
MKHLITAVSACLFLVACTAETGTPPAAGETDAELRPSEAYHEGTDLVWLRCPVGMTWDGVACAGVPADLTFDDAIRGCSDSDPAYRLPTLSELALLLGSCSEVGEAARCQPCADSEGCSQTLSAEDISEWTWTSDLISDSAFVVEVRLGRIAHQDTSAAGVQARCVRPLL